MACLYAIPNAIWSYDYLIFPSPYYLKVSPNVPICAVGLVFLFLLTSETLCDTISISTRARLSAATSAASVAALKSLAAETGVEERVRTPLAEEAREEK